jgi:hypothetical protein
MAEQTQTPVEPQLVQQEEQEGVPDKVVEAVVDEGDPNSYKIVRTATGKNYVEVRACGYTGRPILTSLLSGGASDTTTISSLISCCDCTLQANEYDPLEPHRSVSGAESATAAAVGVAAAAGSSRAASSLHSPPCRSSNRIRPITI